MWVGSEKWKKKISFSLLCGTGRIEESETNQKVFTFTKLSFFLYICQIGVLILSSDDVCCETVVFLL